MQFTFKWLGSPTAPENIKRFLEVWQQKKLPDDAEIKVINLAEEASKHQDKFDKLDIKPGSLIKLEDMDEKPAYEPGRKIQRLVVVRPTQSKFQAMSLKPGAPLPSDKEDFRSSFISENEPIDCNHLMKMEDAYLDMMFAKRNLNPYAILRSQWTDRLAAINKSDIPEQDKDLQRQQLAVEKATYFAGQHRNQEELVKQYYAAGHTEVLTAIIHTSYPLRDMETAIASLNQHLKERARNGGRLTEAERDAFPEAASYEWLEQESDKLRSMAYQEERFRQALAEHDLSLQPGEILELCFDRNYRFSVSGVADDKAKGIEDLLNQDKQLCSTLIHRLIYPYDNKEDWEIEAYPSRPSAQMNDYIKKLQRYDDLVESQVNLLRAHPIELQNVRFIEEKNGKGVYEGRNKAIDGYLKSHPVLISTLDSIRREFAGQKLHFPQSEQPQLKFDGSHFDLNF